MQQKNKWHIAKYQDNKNNPIFVQTAKYCKRLLHKMRPL